MPPATSRSILKRFLELPASERRLLFGAWWRLLFASARLRLRPGPTIAACLATEAATPPPAIDHALARATALAVSRAAAHHLQPMTCLPRALALRKMLASRGIDSVLRIGVRRKGGATSASAATTAIAAHAWIEVAGEPLGEPAAVEERFLPLLRDEPV